MKKVFLTLALAAFAFAANAQFVVSGNFGFGINNDKVNYDGKRVYTPGRGVDKATNFSIDLRGGYQINEKLRAGLFIGFDMNKNVNEAGLASDPATVAVTTTDKSNTFSIGVFGRYNCWQWGKLTVFNELNLGIGTGSGYNEVKNNNTTVKTDNPKLFGFSAYIIPGFSYQISEHVAADLYLDFMSLYFATSKSTTQVNNKDQVNTNTQFGLRIQNMDMSIAGWNSAVRMGVSFTF